MSEAFTRVAEIVAHELNHARKPHVCPDISEATSFQSHLLCSSVDMVCITLEIEDQLGVELPAERLEHCETVGDLAQLVDELRGGRGA